MSAPGLRELSVSAGGKLAVDIGSTVIKVAELSPDGGVSTQHFFPRDHALSISEQLTQLLGKPSSSTDAYTVSICSSANGGLRVGIICLTSRYSGTVLRNQSLLAGANPVFVCTYAELKRDLPPVDVLLVGGGIDCSDPGPIERLMADFKPEDFRFGSLIFVGNRHLSNLMRSLAPSATVVSNPMASTLTGASDSVFELLRNAYLEDIVHKEGVSDLKPLFRCSVRPTPEVVNLGFQRIVSNRSRVPVSGAAILIDIGGATTDLHYTTEIISDESVNRPPFAASVGRYVFTDLGIVASRDSTMVRLRTHFRCYELLTLVVDEKVDDVYRQLREGEWTAPPAILAYACLFLALERFARGDGPGLPSARLEKVSMFLLTGGAAQMLSEKRIAQVVGLLSRNTVPPAAIGIDRDYRIWIDGIEPVDSASQPR